MFSAEGRSKEIFDPSMRKVIGPYGDILIHKKKSFLSKSKPFSSINLF